MSRTTRIVLIGAGAILALLIVPPLIWGGLSGWRGGMWGIMGPDMMGGFSWGWYMPIFMVLFWVMIIWAIVALVRGTARPGGETESALEVLRKRYARGEIDKEEYEGKKKDLM